MWSQLFNVFSILLIYQYAATFQKEWRQLLKHLSSETKGKSTVKTEEEREARRQSVCGAHVQSSQGFAKFSSAGCLRK